MRKITTLISALMLSGVLNVQAQTFWTENFTSGSTGLEVQSYTGPNGAWTLTVTGAEGTEPNRWYVSCQEAGHLDGVCGTTCASSMGLGATLHVGADPSLFGDNGATYDAGGLCGILSCPQTDRRAESPVINCTGKTGITLSFYYIEGGSGTLDDASVWYYNGTAWSMLVNTAKTPLTCSPQGTWTHYSIALPASADNNPNVKIGFRWVNNDDGAGSDPSFAVDSVSLSTAGGSSTPVAAFTTNHTTVCTDSCVILTNTSTGTASIDSFTWSSAGIPIPAAHSTSPLTLCFNDAGTFVVKLYLHEGGVRIDSASTTITVNQSPSPVITVSGSTLSVTGTYTSYQWYSGISPIAGATTSSYTFTTPGIYGVLVDSAGCKGVGVYSSLSVGQVANDAGLFYVAQQGGATIPVHAFQPLDADVKVTIHDVSGRILKSAVWAKGSRALSVDATGFSAGMYIVRLTNDHTSVALRWLRE